MHKNDIQYLRCNSFHLITSIMHSLKSNFDRFYNITKSIFKNRVDQFDNFFVYRNKPKLSDCQIIALAVTDESFGIDSKSYFWGKLKSNHTCDFPSLSDRSNFNCRRRRFSQFMGMINETIAGMLIEGESCFLVDSIPIPVC
jgi:hypothetical protein